MVKAAKKKEAQTTATKQKQQKVQLQLEEQMATTAKYFALQVLPNWESMYVYNLNFLYFCDHQLLYD